VLFNDGDETDTISPVSLRHLEQFSITGLHPAVPKISGWLELQNKIDDATLEFLRCELEDVE
jgi:hypothetical protein